MGGKKKQTIGYKYFVGMHMLLFRGVVDFISRVQYGGKTAWEGRHSEGKLVVWAPDLLGGEQGEGGFAGDLYLESGKPDQKQNTYLKNSLGPLVSAYRGLTGIVAARPYVGNNRYIQQLDIKATRIHKREDGSPQWYDAKSEIRWDHLDNQIGSDSSDWRYKVVPNGSSDAYQGQDIDTSDWLTGAAPFASEGMHPFAKGVGFPPIGKTRWPLNTTIWLRKNFTLSNVNGFELEFFVDNYATVWVNGQLVLPRSGGVDGVNANSFLFSFTVPPEILRTGQNVVAIKAEDFGGYSYAAMRSGTGIRGASMQYDMNPAHILRETITDQGYSDADIDDDSFKAAADQLYDELFGLSVLWAANDSYEEFQRDILRHIDGRMFVDPTSGKFVIKLIRNDYDESTLPVFGPDDIDYVEDYARPQFGELTNSVTVKYADAVSDTQGTETADDPALMRLQGSIINQAIDYPMITNRDLAARVAARDMRVMSSRILSATLHCTRKAASIRPGDPIKFVWPSRHDGYIVCRVVEIGTGDGRSNGVEVKVIEDVFALPQTTSVSAPDTGWVDPDLVPLGKSAAVAVEAPYYELVQRYGENRVAAELSTAPDAGMVLVSATRALGALNAGVYIDGTELAEPTDFSPTMALSAPLDILATSATVAAADTPAPGTHMQIGDEIVRFDALADDGTLTIARGCLDTQPAAHPVGAEFIAWDAFATTDENYRASGESVHVMVQPRKETRVGALSAEVVVAMNGRAHRPYPPANVKIDGKYFPDVSEDLFVATWAHRDRTMQAGAIAGWTDGNIGPESGVTYSVTLTNRDTGEVVATDTGLTAPTWTKPHPHASFPGRLRIASVRDGVECLYPFLHDMTVGAPARAALLTESGNILTTEDGIVLITE